VRPSPQGHADRKASGSLSAVLPARLGAVTGINMLDHLSPADRMALWERLAATLSPGAPVVLTLQPPARPERIAEQPFGEAVAGTRRYSASGAAEPAGPGCTTGKPFLISEQW
jgi:hypothetical protein